MYIDSYIILLLCLFPSATLFLDYLAKEGCFSDKALLLSVNPLKVGGRNVQNKFSEYVPPDSQKGVRYVRGVLTPRLTPVSGNETGPKSV